MGGDELQIASAGKNYGWPVVSWGDNYDGSEIPDPTTHPKFADAVIHWTPTISPSGMIFYDGNVFPEWKNSMMIGGLTSTGIVRVDVDGKQAREVERIPLSVRVRDVEQGPDGTIWVLTDEDNGKILQLKPVK
jgi:glucose/arabinose dehydrogenase